MTSPETGPITIELIVPKSVAGWRIDRYLAGELIRFSRTRLQHLIHERLVRLNGKVARASDRVRTGDRIDLKEPPPEKTENQPEPIPLDVLFEDEYLIVIN